MRAFLAISLPEDVLDALEEVQLGLRVGRPVARENLHLTLVFLDDQPVPVLEEVHAALAALHAPAFELRLGSLGVFGGKQPKVLYAGLAASPPLADLQRRILGVVRASGLTLPRARFRPHITLARFHRAEAAAAQAAIATVLSAQSGQPGAGFAVAEFALLSSQLTPDGPIYEVLACYPLTQ